MNKLIVILFLFSTQSMAQKLIVGEEVKLLALGDSYTIGESVLLRSRWPVQLLDSLSAKGIDCPEPRIIAKTGWRTDDLKAAILRAKLKPEYNRVSLLIGVNNYYQGKSAESYAPEFEELLKIAIDLAGGVKSNVFVLSIPDYGYTPFGMDNQERISAGIDAYNAVNKSITEKSGVRYISITDISRKGLAEPDLVASDGLHPSEKMYAEWVERILTDLKMVRSEEK
jgi:lysophospholipase L1-like esterase